MTTQEVANRLVELCRASKMEEAIQELYSPAIVSLEPKGAKNPMVTGFEGMKIKGEAWREMVTNVNDVRISDPIVAENFFTIGMYMNVDMSNGMKGVQMDELCVYEVRDGKIVTEEFRYTPVPQPAL